MCPTCHGQAHTGGSKTCTECHGTGQVTQMGGRMKFNITCPSCNGTGKSSNDCANCHGEGTVTRSETVEFRIKPGTRDGQRIRLQGKGNAGVNGGPAGDLFLIVRTGTNPVFTRQGDDIHLTVPVTVAEASLGAKVEVPTIDGRAQLKIPPGTQSGQKLRMRERGVESAQQPGQRGDEIVTVTVVVPHLNDERSREIMRELGKLNPQRPAQGAVRQAVRSRDQGIEGTRKQLRRDEPAQRSARLIRERAMATKRKSKGAYMISAVAEMYEIHPQTLRLYEREGLLKPSRTEGNTRLYTDEDLERLEFILNLARDLGVNIAGIGIILQMRERMEEMNRQMQNFVEYVRSEMLTRFPAGRARLGRRHCAHPQARRRHRAPRRRANHSATERSRQ